MTKYGLDFRLDVVEFYYASGQSKQYVERRYGINKNQLNNWIYCYERFGIDGLKNGAPQKKYSFEFKREAVLSVVEGGLTFTEAKEKFAMRSDSLIVSWLRSYRKHGMEGLQPKPKGRQPAMKKKIEIDFSKPDAQKTQEEIMEELEYLRAENAFLKKWNALMKEKREKQKQGLQ